MSVVCGSIQSYSKPPNEPDYAGLFVTFIVALSIGTIITLLWFPS